MYKFHAEYIAEKLNIETNLIETKLDGYLVFSKREITETTIGIVEIAKRYHCICIKETEDSVVVLNDPFSSFPIYLYRNNSEFIIDTVFENFKNKSLSLDITGCYEKIMYESGIFDRTPIKEIKEMPAASKAVYNLNDKSLNIVPYWDFNIDCKGEVKEQNAIDSVWSALLATYGQYKDKDILMGVSGGLDSRLSLCLLSQVSNSELIDTFTFGHNRCIKDYKYASYICDQLRLNRPVFFKLTDNSYREGTVVPMKTGGTVGINHTHAWYCLNHSSIEGKTLISNYYSDGIMGYDCRPTDTNDKEKTDYYKILNRNRWGAPQDVLDEIRADLDKVVDRRAMSDNFSGFNEYIYLTERNPKFHIKLSYLYSELLPVELPFATYELLHAVISLPQQLRYYKKIEHLILSDKLGDYNDISSTRYAGLDKEEKRITDKWRYNIGFVNMLCINRMNAGLKLLSNGYIQIPNPYITENHLAVFDRCFSEEKVLANNSLEMCFGKKIIYNPLSKINYRSVSAEEGFNLLSLYYFLEGVNLPS